MRSLKDSGVDWINKVPNDWQIKRLKAVLCERNETNNPVKTDFILSLTNDRGIIPYTEKGDLGNKSKDDLSGYKLAYPNDIVLNSMNVIIGSVALSNYFGCVSPVYYMLYPRFEESSIQYFNYLFQTKELQNKLRGYGNGIMEIRMRIQMSKLNTVELPIPPFDVQHKIARFLDDKCERINLIITQQQELIEKIKKYKQACVTEMVINENLPIYRLRHCINNIEQGWSSPPAEKVDEENGWFVLSLSAIKGGKFNSKAKKPIDSEAKIPLNLEIIKGDFLMTRSNTRELVGDICLVSDCDSKTIFSDLIYRIRFNDLLLPEYANYLLQSAYIRQQIQESARGSSGTMPKISHKAIKDIKIYLPSKEEQKSLSLKLDVLCNKLELLITKKQELISKLTDYKNSLIYEVVTGKREV